MIRQCAICGAAFSPKYPETRTCSKPCANTLTSQSRMKGRRKECEQCGNSFYVPQWREKTNPRFCSNACYGVWKSKNFSGEANTNWRGKTAPRPCAACDEVFTPTWNNQKACSPQCVAELRGRANRGERNYQWTGGEDRECSHCGTSFHVPRPSYPKVYCSKSCASKANRMSRNQKKLFAILQDLLADPDMEMEKTWDWLLFPKTGRHLYADIYSPKHNLVVEYDGRHHHDPRAFSNGEVGLELTQQRDAAKAELLAAHDIRLIRYNGPVTKNLVIRAIA